jgi:uncharacterized UBP type Zn finger protein
MENKNANQTPFAIGLRNNGNYTCYMNTCFASLCSFKSFYSVMTNSQIKRLTQNNHMLHSFIGILESLYQNNSNGANKYKSQFIASFFIHQEKNNGTFTRGAQEDAQEFMFFLFNYVEETLIDMRNQMASPAIVLDDAISCINHLFLEKM